MSESKKLLVILGVTGIQGGSVAKVFLESHPEWRLRGITRNPDKPSNASLRDSGVELVAGDLDDPASLAKAFEGADAIFAVTDFWQFVQQQPPEGQLPNQFAFDKEVQQGKNIVDAAAAAHAKKPLHRLVLSVLADSTKGSNGKVVDNLHFDSKARYVQYLKATYPDLASVSSYIHVGYYLSNAFAFPFWSPYPDPNDKGTYILPTSERSDTKNLVPFVNPPQDMGYFVEALVSKAPPQTTMLGYCRQTSMEEYARIWGEALSVKTKLRHLKYEDFLEAGLPEWLSKEINASGEWASHYGWTGGEEDVKGPEECGIDMGKLTDIGEWIKGQDWKLVK